MEIIYFIIVPLLLVSIFFSIAHFITTNQKLDKILHDDGDMGYIFLKIDNDELGCNLLKSNIFKYKENGPNGTKLYSYNKDNLNNYIINKYINHINSFRFNNFNNKTIRLCDIITYASMIHNILELCNHSNVVLPDMLIPKNIRDFISSSFDLITKSPNNNVEVFELIYAFESLEEYCYLVHGAFESSIITSDIMEILKKLNEIKFKYLDMDKINRVLG